MTSDGGSGDDARIWSCTEAEPCFSVISVKLRLLRLFFGEDITVFRGEETNDAGGAPSPAPFPSLTVARRDAVCA